MARRRRPEQSRNNRNEIIESNGIVSVGQTSNSITVTNDEVSEVTAALQSNNDVLQEKHNETKSKHATSYQNKSLLQQNGNEDQQPNGTSSNACGIVKQIKESNKSKISQTANGKEDDINIENDDNENESDEVDMKHVCSPSDKVAALNAFALYSTERLKEIENDVLHSNERCKSKKGNSDERQINSIKRQQNSEEDTVKLSSQKNVKDDKVSEHHNVVKLGDSSNNDLANADSASNDSLRPSLSTSEVKQSPNNKVPRKVKRVHIISPAIEPLPDDLDNEQHPRESRCLQSTCAKCVIM